MNGRYRHPRPSPSRRNAPGPNAQRSTVKIKFRGPSGAAGWAAHGRYIARQAARPDPENKGLGFDAEREDVKVSATLSEWERAGDKRLWSFVVSPENGARMDLQQHARDLLGVLEKDLQTRLEWVAVVHDHNDHPHIHIALRGRREDGEPLYIDRETISYGVRFRSQELATRELGPRTAADRARAREAGVTARYVGALDHEIERRAGQGRAVEFRSRPAPGSTGEFLWRRLEHLESLGVAEKQRPGRWHVPGGFRDDLRRVQHLRDIQRALGDPEVSLSEPARNVEITRITAGRELTGRMAGTLFDERSERVHLVIEGTDGVVHVVPQTRPVERARADGRLQTGGVVTLVGLPIEREGSTRSRVQPSDHGSLEAQQNELRPTTALDRDALRAVRDLGALPDAVAAGSRFARTWREGVRERRDVLLRAALVEEQIERGEARHRLTAKGERMMEDRGRERTPVNLEELRRADTGLREAPADPGQQLRGQLTALAYDRDGQQHAILDTGRERLAIPTHQNDLQVGQEYQAQSRAEREADRRRVAWQLDDLERLRERDHGLAR
jgi:type IV secretory pathway VirD2 relaxase